MSRIDLLSHEGILKRDSEITHDKRHGRGSWAGELILTNLALLVVHKGVLGGTKEVIRWPLSEIKVINGVPQVIAGKSASGQRQLHIYFSHGMEAFTLGISDEDEEISLKNIFTPASNKEMRNVDEWREAISRAVYVGCQSASMVGASAAPQNVLGAAAGSPSSHPVPQQVAVAAGAKEIPAYVTSRCIGCMAPISGIRGQKTICRYCDTEQVVSQGVN